MIPSSLPRPDLAPAASRASETNSSPTESSFARLLEQRQPGPQPRPTSEAPGVVHSPRPAAAHINSAPARPQASHAQSAHSQADGAISTADETEPCRHPQRRARSTSDGDGSNSTSELGYWLNALTAVPNSSPVPPAPEPPSGSPAHPCPNPGAQESDTPTAGEANSHLDLQQSTTGSISQSAAATEPVSTESPAIEASTAGEDSPLDTAVEALPDAAAQLTDPEKASPSGKKMPGKPLHLTGFSPSSDSSATDGMPFARKPVAMKDPDISDQFAGGGEQNLPTFQPARIESAGPAPSHDGRPIPASTTSAVPTVTTPAAAVVSAADPSVNTPGTAAVAATARPHQGTSVEHIAHLLATEGALLRAHRAESLAVVIQPDAQTQLFLQLRQRNGEMEATVRCEQGDFQALNASWRELQESLARQDIRLADLRPSVGSPLPGSTDRPAPQDQPANHGSRQRQRPTEDTEDLPMVGSVTEPLRQASSSRPRRSNKFESWA